MRYTKQALTIEEQIGRLKGRGLLFQDENYAKDTLLHISYYRLRAYTYPFQDNTKPEHPFTQEIDFETIISLYQFDQNLRILIFDAMEQIEVALRTQIIYQYAVDYGSHWHTERSLYKPNTNYKGEYYYDIHQKTLETEVSRSGERFIEHYYEKYDTPFMPPSWMTLEVVSMGTLSKIYKNLKICNAKKRIPKYLGLPNPYILENWMLAFSHLRNICAHHSRLWNRRLTTKIELPKNTARAFYSKEELQKIHPNKVFAALLAINYILNALDKNNDFEAKLKELMKTCPLDQEHAMGFAPDWQQHSFWNQNTLDQ